MNNQKFSFEISVYNSLDELNQSDYDLMQAAITSRKKAYAPYSNFLVGAAVLLANGEVILGNNQESASYPAGICAERVAVSHAAAIHPNVAIKAIAISATSKKQSVKKPAAPCGICRQSLVEYEQKQKMDIQVLMMGEEGEIHKCHSISDILPLAFNSSFLE